MIVNNFNVTPQEKYFNKADRYKVKHPFLKKCLGWGDENFIGFTNGKAIGYAYLTYFAEEALGFRRYPNRVDRIWSEISFQNKNFEEFEGLSKIEVEEIIKEVKTIYNHTQLKLQEKGLNEVNVKRRIRFKEESPLKHYSENYKNYPQLLYDLKQAAEFVERESITVEMDILNSYGGAYTGPISINAKIKAEDIFYCHSLLDLGSGYLEEGEWVVINKDPKGLVEIPLTWIELNPKHDLEKYIFDSTDEALSFLDGYQVFRLPRQNSSSGTWPRMFNKLLKRCGFN